MNNNIIRYAIIFLVILAYAGDICPAQDNEKKEVSKKPVSVNANVDKARTTIGDKISYTITVDFPKGTEVFFPEITKKVGGLTVKDFNTEEIEKEEDRITRKINYILETYKNGSYIIPAIEIKYREEPSSEAKIANTPEIFVEVASTLDENASDVRDIKPPVELRKNYFRLYIIIAIVFGALALAAIVLHFLHHRKYKKADSLPEPLLAHQIAYNELESLKNSDLISGGRIKEYYYLLSNIVRHYIENRFHLMAPERTTEEFLGEITVTGRFTGEHKELVEHFLEHCDMVKFAKYGPDSSEIENAFNSAKKLVDETREIFQEEQVLIK